MLMRIITPFLFSFSLLLFHLAVVSMQSSSSDRSLADLNHVFTKNDQKSKANLKWCPGSIICIIALALFGLTIVLIPIFKIQIESYSTRVVGVLQAASFILENRNTSVNPCDDFYEYACGNYAKNNPVAPGRKTQSEHFKHGNKVKSRVFKLLTSSMKSSSEAITKVRTLFASCINANASVNPTPHGIMKFVKTIGHWPILMGDQETEIDLQTMFEKIRAAGMKLPWKIHEDFNQKNKSLSLRFEDPDLPPLSENPFRNYDTYHENESRLAARKKGVRDTIQMWAQELGYPKNPNLERDVDEMFKFEAELADAPYSSSRERNVALEMPQFELFDDVSNRLNSETGIDLKKIHLSGISKFAHGLYNSGTVVRFAWLAQIFLEFVKKTEPRIVANYLMYFLPFSYKFDYPRDTNETKVKCWDVAMTMKKAVAAMYARKYTNLQAVDKIEQMADKMREEFIEMLEESEWMDDETKRKAKKKAKEMIAYIGYNELVFDDEKLDKYYEEVDVSNDFFTMIKSLNIWEQNEKYLFLISDRRQVFKEHQSLILPLNYIEYNSLLIPAAFAQFPIFHIDQPPSLNYGAMGSAIGHEMVHSFDNKGREYNEIGEHKNWWADNTSQIFAEKSKCFVDQYSANEVPGTDGLHADGEKCLGENIADNGGIRTAFRTYKKYANTHGKGPKLPRVDLTDDQLFFVGYANFYCKSLTKAYLMELIKKDPHAPHQFRTNIVMQNMPEFSEAFSCPVGSPMNPEKKCRVW